MSTKECFKRNITTHVSIEIYVKEEARNVNWRYKFYKSAST